MAIRTKEHCLTGLKWQFKGDNNIINLSDAKLPFGARISPAVFNRITQSIQRMLMQRNYNYVVLLDDFFVTAEAFEKCLAGYTCLVSLLRSLGFRINWKKVVGIRTSTVSGHMSLDPVKTE